MQFLSKTSSGKVTEQLFTLDDIPGVLWTPSDARAPHSLILMGHGGGQHKKASAIVTRARRFAVDGGFAVAAIDAPHHGRRPTGAEFDRLAAEYQARAAAGEDTDAVNTALYTLIAAQSVTDWQRVLNALQLLDDIGIGPAGYWGMSLGCALGIPLIAAEPRIRAAVVGLQGAPLLARPAAQITVPVQFLLQQDDELIPPAQGLALFDAIRSPDKTLHTHPGRHGDLPPSEIDDSLRFFTRHLK